MAENLSASIFEKAKKLGADLVSACSVEQMAKYPGAKETIAKIDSNANSILVFGIRMISSSIASSRKNIRIPQFATRLLYEDLSRVCFGLMKTLDDLGFTASPIPTYLPVPMEGPGRGLIGDLSIRHAAYEAGLGAIGKNRLLITPEFGPRVRFAAILTSAQLEPGKPIKEDFCSDCGACVESCPTGSLAKKGEEAIILCTKHHMKYGLPGLVRFSIKLIKAKTDDEKIALVTSPEFWEYWQNLNTGIFYYCYDCLNICPTGK